MSEYMMKSGMKNGMQLNISIIDWKKVSPPKLVVQKRSKKKYLKKNILHSKMMNNPVNCLRINLKINTSAPNPSFKLLRSSLSVQS